MGWSDGSEFAAMGMHGVRRQIAAFAPGVQPEGFADLDQPVVIDETAMPRCGAGRMQQLLEAIPVKIVLNEDAVLFGAARFTLLQKAFRS